MGQTIYQLVQDFATTCCGHGGEAIQFHPKSWINKTADKAPSKKGG